MNTEALNSSEYGPNPQKKKWKKEIKLRCDPDKIQRGSMPNCSISLHRTASLEKLGVAIHGKHKNKQTWDISWEIIIRNSFQAPGREAWLFCFYFNFFSCLTLSWIKDWSEEHTVFSYLIPHRLACRNLFLYLHEGDLRVRPEQSVFIIAEWHYGGIERYPMS